MKTTTQTPRICARGGARGTTGHRPASGFSLLELLTVVAIIVMLLGLAVPAIAPILRASSLNSGSSMIMDEFNYIRQLALTKNRDVEIRFYHMGTQTEPTQLEYRAFRSFLIKGGAAADAEALSPVKYLPKAVILSADPKFSSLLDYTNPVRSCLTHGQEILPRTSTPVSYVSFLFRATGGTNLSPINPPLGNWFLTLHLEKAAVNTNTGIPDNYINVQLDPVTGRVRMHRP